MLVSLTELKEREPFEFELVLPENEATELLELDSVQVVGDTNVIVTLVRFPNSVKVTAQCQFDITYECGRCLEYRTLTFDEATSFVLMSEQQFRSSKEDDEVELTADDLDVVFFDGLEIETNPLVRQSMLEPLPTYLVCGPELQSECDAAYVANIGEVAVEANEEAKLDLRWAPILALKNKKD